MQSTVDVWADFDIDQPICRKMTTCHMSAWTLEHALGTGDSQLCNAVHTGWAQISRRKRAKNGTTPEVANITGITPATRRCTTDLASSDGFCFCHKTGTCANIWQMHNLRIVLAFVVKCIFCQCKDSWHGIHRNLFGQMLQLICFATLQNIKANTTCLEHCQVKANSGAWG